MKRKILKPLLLILVLVIVFSYLQYGRTEQVTNSYSSSSAGIRDEHLTIVANKLFIINKEQYANELINKALTDRLNRFCFSWDMGIPHSIKIDVYLTKIAKRNGNIAYTIIYQPIDNNTSCNVIDNPEKYTLQIKH